MNFFSHLYDELALSSKQNSTLRVVEEPETHVEEWAKAHVHFYVLETADPTKYVGGVRWVSTCDPELYEPANLRVLSAGTPFPLQVTCQTCKKKSGYRKAVREARQKHWVAEESI